jgi:hypothetical protein
MSPCPFRFTRLGVDCDFNPEAEALFSLDECPTDSVIETHAAVSPVFSPQQALGVSAYNDEGKG